VVEETVNGQGVSYQYDGRGNISRKQYHDGSAETGEWNGYDRETRYTDRDGVVIFRGTYNSRGQVVSAAMGNRAAEQYGYDGLGYATGRI
jgi:YD repeat-containing protein